MNEASKRLAFGVEIGGTKLQLAVGTEDGDLIEVERGSVAPDGGAAGILNWIQRKTARLLDQAQKAHRAPEAIGVGFGGPVDTATGRVLTSHQIAGWQNVELKHWFEQQFALPTVVANDANAAGWAEFRLGAGQGTRNFFYMNIGSGIGGALILDGRLYDGQGQGAGEIGHTYIPDWTADQPGAADKLEHLCSGWSIEKRLQAQEAPVQTCVALAEAARTGDAFACAEIERVAQGVGRALANVITLFHPERVALGGGVSLMGDVLLEPLRRQVDALVFGPFRGRYEILPCALEESVVIAGALLLALDT